MSIDARAFRNALGQFPTGIVVVTAPAAGRDPLAMTVSSFNAVSLDPPLVLFSIGRNAPSLSLLLEAPRFAISVLRADQADVSSRFAFGRGEKWAGFQPAVGETGCPVIRPSLATFECSPFATHEGGDHLIIVGRVDHFDMAAEGAPLVFFRGGYHAIGSSAA
jgi:flavin reductase (DIM6/NTAB) family NADH-FMN oxidoreductase RutF